MATRLRNMPLWLRLLIRRLRSHEGKLAPLAMLAIAVSVTLATGLEMSSRSAELQLNATANAIRGSAEIEIIAGDVGVPEEVLERVRAIPGVRAASPLVSGKLAIVGQHFALNLIGVDLVAEEQVRGTELVRNGLQLRDALRLLAVPNSVVVTEQLLGRLGLLDQYRAGELASFVVRSNGIESSLTVQGVLRPTGIAAAFGGQVAVMDVYSAQTLAGRIGRFDRIDVVPTVGQDASALMARIRSDLAGLATVQPASARSSAAENLLKMVRRSALMLAGAASLVACLLTYATTSQWVDRQRRQLATLRAVGMEAHRLRKMLFFEVTILALTGSALGIVGGIAISPPLLATISTFLKVVKGEELSGISVEASTLWIAMGVGLFAGIAGGAIPARRAAQRFTLDALDLDLAAHRRAIGTTSIGIPALAAFVALAAFGSRAVDDRAMLRLGTLFVLGSIGILSMGPVLLRSTRVVMRAVEDLRPGLGHLVSRFFHLRPWTFSVALASISILVGALVTVFLLIATVTVSVDRWTESRFPGNAIIISPTPFTGPLTNDLLTPRTMELIRKTPGVSAVDERYRVLPSVIFRGRTVPLVASSMDVIARHGHIPTLGRPSAEVASELHDGAVAISTGFAKTFGISPGDSIDLDTMNGSRQFRIADIYEDFGDSNGSILLDLAVYDENWRRDGAWSAMIWIDGSVESTLDSVRERVAPVQDLFIATANDVAAANREQTGVFTATLRVLGVFISSLGGIGVMILLAGIVSERRKDLAVLRAAGAEPGTLVQIVLADALLLGIMGSACGTVLGLACAVPAVDVLRESFGWVLEQHWFAPELPYILAGALISSIVGALPPAWFAYRAAPDDVFGPE